MDSRWRTHDLVVGKDQPVEVLTEKLWLLTNGIGDYAMGTAAGCNTSRYHGLLVGSTRPSVGRVMAINQVFEQLVINKTFYEPTNCQFECQEDREDLTSQGDIKLQRFERGLSVRWSYVLSETGSGQSARGLYELNRELFLHWGQQSATLRYQVRCCHDDSCLPRDSLLRISPMATLRDVGTLLHAADGGSWSLEQLNEATVIITRGDLSVTVACDQSRFIVSGPRQDPWRRGVRYPLETERGLEDQEDYFVPGFFEVDLPPDQKSVVTMTIALGQNPADMTTYANDDRHQHLQRMLEHVVGDADTEANHLAVKTAMVIAADDFVIDRSFRDSTFKTVMAGYPWLTDRGRDTLIAVSGLLMATGRYEEAKTSLSVFSEAIHNGLVPDRFDSTEAQYSDVDTSLWFVNTVLEYVRISGDKQSWEQWLAEAVMTVIEAFLRGTQNDIRMAGDGLISAGSSSTGLTWMDATRESVALTPRHGKAVEVNVLWYNALAGVAKKIVDTHKRTADHYTKLAKRVKRSFTKVFWDDELGYLRDHVWSDAEGQDHVDSTLRPNQILAVSLPLSPLPATKQRKVLEVIKRRLLTPFGLRTLPQDDPNYHGRYAGSALDRDAAYYQGTVWAWLIGPYAEGVLRVDRFSDASKEQVRALLEPLLGELTGGGLGQLHEIYEGDPPHRCVGCMAQAWSVGEVLRVLRLLDEH